MACIASTACERPRQDDCTDCAIQLEYVVTLGTRDGPGALSSIPVAVAEDSRGRFYVTTPQQGVEPPFVYDSRGNFLQRLGRGGEGPGEYTYPMEIVVTAGDTLHIFDDRTRRLTVLSPSYEVVRTAPGLPGTWAALQLGSGNYVVNNTGRGYPLHLLDPLGAPVRSFGAAAEVYQDQANRRAIAQSQAGGIWTARSLFQTLIEHWDSNGVKTREIFPGSDWFEPFDRIFGPAADRRPFSEVTGLWEDSLGLLWILGWAADPEWKKSLGPMRRVEGQLMNRIDDYSQVYDSIIEVLDHRDGTVLATRRLDHAGMPMGVVRPGVIFIRRESEEGWWFADVLRATFDVESDVFSSDSLSGNS